MAYVELEQFLDQGAIRILAGLSRQTFAGAVVGGVLGSQLTLTVASRGSWPVVFGVALGIILGAALMMKRRGIENWKRWSFALLYFVRGLTGSLSIDGLAHVRAEEDRGLTRVRRHTVRPEAQPEPQLALQEQEGSP